MMEVVFKICVQNNFGFDFDFDYFAFLRFMINRSYYTDGIRGPFWI